MRARKEACVTRIEGVDDVVREESEEQMKQDEEEELGEWKTTRKHDRRQPSERQRIEHEVTYLPFRTWGSSHFLFKRARCFSRSRAFLVLLCPSVYNPVK